MGLPAPEEADQEDQNGRPGPSAHHPNSKLQQENAGFAVRYLNYLDRLKGIKHLEQMAYTHVS